MYIVQTAYGTGASPTISPVTAGNLAFIMMGCRPDGAVTPWTMTDNASQSWTQGDAPYVYMAGTAGMTCFWVQDSAAITSITPETSGIQTTLYSVFVEVAGVNTSGAADQNSGGGVNGNSASPSVSATGATAQANEIAFGCIVSLSGSGSLTSVTSGWTALTPYVGSIGGGLDVFPFYQILSAETSLTLAGTLSSGSNYWGGIMQTFKGSGSSSTNGNFLPLLRRR